MKKKIDVLKDKKYSLKDAGKLLGCSERKVRQMRDDGILLCIQIGGTYLVSESVLEQYLTERYVEAGII